jgi:hypothetical protein
MTEVAMFRALSFLRHFSIRYLSGIRFFSVILSGVCAAKDLVRRAAAAP